MPTCRRCKKSETFVVPMKKGFLLKQGERKTMFSSDLALDAGWNRLGNPLVSTEWVCPKCSKVIGKINKPW